MTWINGLRQSGMKDGALFANWKCVSDSVMIFRFWPNSFNAHRVLAYARSRNFKNIHDLVLTIFRAVYELGENISLIDTLSRLAEQVGLYGVKQMLESDQFIEEVLEEDDFAKCDLEIQ